MSKCVKFVSSVEKAFPELTKKPKIHLLLHLVESLQDFGPAPGLIQKGIVLNHTFLIIID